MREPWATLDAADIDEDLDPDHVRLAAALCSLPFVPYPLLRAVRKYVCPAVSERLFCESPLVDGVSADGVSLDPVTRERLRRHAKDRYARVADGPDAVALETLRAILDTHARELSPLLAIEERMLWAWLTIGDGDEFRRACDSCLHDVIGTAVLQEGRTKIYRWASAAARRLPVECFHSALGWLLGELCDNRNIPFPLIEPPSDAFGGSGPLHALAVGLPDRPLGLHRDGKYLELGPVNGTRHVAVLVADTDPIAVRVEAAGEKTKMTTVWLPQRHHVVRLPVGRDAVTLTDLRGRTYLLAGFAGDEAPETEQARTALEGAIAFLIAREPVHFTVLRKVKTGYVVSLTDVGCDALLPGKVPPLQPGDEGHGTIVGVVPEQRRVFVRRLPGGTDAEPGQDPPLLSVSPDIPSRFQVPVVRLGKVHKARRSLYVRLANGHPLWPYSKDGPPHHGAVANGCIRFADAARLTADGDWEPTLGSLIDVRVISMNERSVLLGVGFGDDLSIRRIKLLGPDGERAAQDVTAWLEPETLQVGQQLYLSVANITKYGVSCKLPDNREGFLHTSVIYPRSHDRTIPYAIGDTIRVWIAAIDRENQQIALTQEPPWTSVLGQEMELAVEGVVSFGVFLSLPDGRPGLLHESGMLPPQDPKRYRPGDRLRVQVVSEDAEARRISFTQLA
jgi:predicted RNA-binding protein with RPS1 domain